MKPHARVALLVLTATCSTAAFSETVKMLESKRLRGKLQVEAFAIGPDAKALYESLSGPRYVVFSRDLAGFTTTSLKLGDNQKDSPACFSVFDERSTRYSCYRLLESVNVAD